MFVIRSNTKELVEQITRKHGSYILGKTVLKEPLSRMKLSLEAFPDHVELSATIEGTIRKQNNVTTLIEKTLSDQSYRVHTAQHITIGSDKETEEPKVSIHLCNNRQNPYIDAFRYITIGSIVDRDDRQAPKKSKNETVPFTLSVLMGHDEEVTLNQIPTDDNLENALGEFIALCQSLVNAFYETQPPVSKEKQILSLQPARINETEKSNDIFSSMFGGQFGGDKKKLEKAINIEKPATTFAQIGGLPKAKLLMSRLATALQNPAAYKKWGTRPPKGVLLHGSPGTGKTLLTKALANAVKASFYHVKITDILSMWHGKSEEHIDQVFCIAKENAPSVIFFDELDALGRDRNIGSESSGKLVAILLQHMDGIEELERVIVVGATNRLEPISKVVK